MAQNQKEQIFVQKRLGARSPTHVHLKIRYVPRLTITLSEPRHRALRKTAAVRGKTIGQLIDESLDFYGVKSVDDAAELVRFARAVNEIS